MNTYVIMLDKISNTPLPREIIDRHIAHLRNLSQAGQLILSGPFTDYPSGMVVIKASTKEEAIRIAEADPFVREGVRKYEVRTWLLATEENNFLG